MKNKLINLKENGEGYMGIFRRRKTKREIFWLNYNLNIKIIKKKYALHESCLKKQRKKKTSCNSCLIKVQTNITTQEAQREKVASKHEKPHRHET